MSVHDCRKNNTYHNILKKYIDEIGRTERPANRSELPALPADESPLRGRSVGQVVNRNGLWEIHLVQVEADERYRLVKRKLRSYTSRRMAEIVARYTAEVKCCKPSSGSAGGITFSDICWN